MPSRLRQCRVNFARWLNSPWALMLLSAAIVVDVASLPAPWPRGQGGSLVKAIVMAPKLLGVTTTPRILTVCAERTESGWIAYDSLSTEESYDACIRFRSNPPEIGAMTMLVPKTLVHRWGLWAPIVEVRRHHLNFAVWGDDSPETAAQARTAICDRIADLGREWSWPTLVDFGESARIANSTTTRFLWGGAAHTVVGLLLVGAFISSARRNVRALKAAIRRRRRRVGMCPTCRYCLAGLPPDSVCPECGVAPPLQSNSPNPEL